MSKKFKVWIQIVSCERKPSFFPCLCFTYLMRSEACLLRDAELLEAWSRGELETQGSSAHPAPAAHNLYIHYMFVYIQMPWTLLTVLVKSTDNCGIVVKSITS